MAAWSSEPEDKILVRKVLDNLILSNEAKYSPRPQKCAAALATSDGKGNRLDAGSKDSKPEGLSFYRLDIGVKVGLVR